MYGENSINEKVQYVEHNMGVRCFYNLLQPQYRTQPRMIIGNLSCSRHGGGTPSPFISGRLLGLIMLLALQPIYALAIAAYAAMAHGMPIAKMRRRPVVFRYKWKSSAWPRFFSKCLFYFNITHSGNISLSS